jgi:hypothetical protein
MPKTNLKFVINTGWPIFQDKSNSQYYLLVGQVWLMANDLPSPWVRTTNIPKDLNKLPDSGRWIDVKNIVPAPGVTDPIIPKVFYSINPGQVILFDGQPSHIPIPKTLRVGADDLLDAAAADWTALRWYRNEAVCVCTPEHDEKGLVVAIYY